MTAVLFVLFYNNGLLLLHVYCIFDVCYELTGLVWGRGLGWPGCGGGGGRAGWGGGDIGDIQFHAHSLVFRRDAASSEHGAAAAAREQGTRRSDCQDTT